MKLLKITGVFLAITSSFICNAQEKKVTQETSFDYVVEQFADIKVLRYQIPGWENLTLKEQELVYYLTQAGTAGRDIMWDQNYKYNLKIRKALEQIYQTYSGDKTTEDWKNFEIYLKRVWFSNGIHHHYSSDKIKPGFTEEYFLLDSGSPSSIVITENMKDIVKQNMNAARTHCEIKIEGVWTGVELQPRDQGNNQTRNINLLGTNFFNSFVVIDDFHTKKLLLLRRPLNPGMRHF